MSAIATIRRFRVPLAIALACFVLLFVFELVHLQSLARGNSAGTFKADRLTTSMFFLPGLGATLCFFPLCYLVWFQNPQNAAFTRIRKVFFWTLVGVAGFVWFFILKSLIAWR